MIFGDRRKYLVALIALNPDRLIPWAKDAGIATDDFAALTAEPKVVTLVQRIVDERNLNFARFEQIKKFAILPKQFTQEEDEITPSLKLKKKVVAEKYRAIFDRLYPPGEGFEA